MVAPIYKQSQSTPFCPHPCMGTVVLVSDAVCQDRDEGVLQVFALEAEVGVPVVRQAQEHGELALGDDHWWGRLLARTCSWKPNPRLRVREGVNTCSQDLPIL